MRAASRWGRVVVAGLAVAGLFGVDVLAGDVPVAAAVTAPAAAAAAPVVEAPDLVSARVAARAQGVRVEAVSERTEYATTFVNPDGTLTTDASLAPVRFKDASAPEAQGGWRQVDLTLKAAGSDVVPTGPGVKVRLSGGGTAGSDFASVDHGADARGAGRTVSWALGGSLKGAKLPVPVLKDNTATYPNVAPGVDVRVQVRPRGFEQDFIVKDRAAAAAVATAGGFVADPAQDEGADRKGHRRGRARVPRREGGAGLVHPARVRLGREDRPALGRTGQQDGRAFVGDTAQSGQRGAVGDPGPGVAG